MASRDAIVQTLRHGLIASCQADEGASLRDPAIMAAIATAAVQGGAVAVRARGKHDIRAIAAVVTAPIIGLTKRHYPAIDIQIKNENLRAISTLNRLPNSLKHYLTNYSPVYITPTWDDIVACLDAGADIVAVDATDRPRPDGLALPELVRRVRATSDALLMADIASLPDGEAAAALGFDLISTTLAGYTACEPPSSCPDLDLVAALVARVRVPIIAEGRITTPAQAAEALRRGAWAVCVGKAITAPQFITGRFVQALRAVPLVDERIPHGGRNVG